MTDLLQPAVGSGQEELPRQALRRSGLTPPVRLLVLLVGGEVDLLRLRQAWSGKPIDVDSCQHLASALVMVGKSAPDLVVIGESEGPLDQFEFLRALRQVDSTTVVVVGLDEQHADLESAALVAGANAVVRRPFATAELMGLLPPTPGGRENSRHAPLPIDLGRLKVDVFLPRIWLDGIECLIPHMEFRLLHYLAARPGEIVARDELESAAWGERAAARSNSLSVHLARLRRRFQAGTGEDWICSVRGFGYRLVVPPPVDTCRPAPGI